ncbi:MAG: AraC family transcriptional regulator ligand-binding domain-containing protein [Pseudomonas sp.]|jgi:AraC-like DNA-binding protein|uniref:AraC family transcriptional regulator n=1 Tax=Halopseudomonas sp. TaxID=2901191 RepID=UPI001B40A3C6|nr:AraC family transcriptional regulator ligand-binding domain-containing protein [Pseudomonas sp.]
MDWRQRRDNTNVRLLLELAAELGVPARQCLANTGLQDRPFEELSSLQLWQELAVIRNLVAQHSQPGTGLRLGQRYHLTSLGLLGYTMLASRSLMDAIEITSQFRPLAMSICPVNLHPDKSGLWMVLDASVLPEDARCLVVERGMAAWKCVYSELLQRPFVPLAIEICVPSAGPAELYNAHFECAADMNAARNAMLIAWEDLHSALPLANAMTQRTCANLCQHLCDSLDDIQAPLARQVLQSLMSHSGRIHPARDVAGWLGLSERTLHRRLALEGHPFRQLDERVRRNLAERLLGDTTLGLDSIAQQLGYAEAASFSRAFKRWAGCSPDQWRRQRSTRPLSALAGALADMSYENRL